MNILILGGGGREHALGWKIKPQNKHPEFVFRTRNAGTASVGKNIPVSVADFPNIGKACLDLQIDLVVVGLKFLWCRACAITLTQPRIIPCSPGGTWKIRCPPGRQQGLSKQFMVRHGIPTAKGTNILNSNIISRPCLPGTMFNAHCIEG